MEQAFRLAEHVRRRPEFERAYREGARVPARFLTLFVLSNGREFSRLGVSATRKLGSAVERNRVKRLSRELFRRHKVAAGIDIIIVPRREMLDASFDSLEADYQAALDRRHRARPAERRPQSGRGGRPGRHSRV